MEVAAMTAAVHPLADVMPASRCLGVGSRRVAVLRTAIVAAALARKGGPHDASRSASNREPSRPHARISLG